MSQGGGGTSMYYSSTNVPNTAWTKDANATFTDGKDMCAFENDSRADSGRQQVFVTRDTTIASLNDTGNNAWVNDWWNTNAGITPGLKTGVPHPIEYFPFVKKVLVGDGNVVHTIQRTSDTTNETVSTRRLVLPTRYEVRHFLPTANRVWILCKNILQGLNGVIVEWDGFSETFNRVHDAYSPIPLSGVNFKETPIILNDKGTFLEYTGQGFTPMMRNGQLMAIPSAADPSLYLSDVLPRGMTVAADGLIYINVYDGTLSTRGGSGVYCLNPDAGRVYKKHAIGAWANTDFGQQFTQGAGAIHATDLAGSSFLISGFYGSDASTPRPFIATLASANTETASRGYFVTQYFPANDVREVFDTLWVRFKRFITSTNSIVVKARGVRPLVGATAAIIRKTITWVNATSFTVTLSAADDALMVGDEVEILSGENSGMLAHISTISGSHGAQQTITMDETGTASIATGIARFDRWKKLGVITDKSQYEDVVNIGIPSSFIQFKVELRGPSRELEVESLILTIQPDIYKQR